MSSQKAYHVYCLVQEPTPVSLAEHPEITVIRYKDIAAIVHEVEIAQEKELRQTQQQWLMNHQQINIDLVRQYTILPLRFGALAGHSTEIQDFLAAGYLQIKMLLSRIMGKVEVVVHLFWDLQMVLEEIRQDPQVSKKLHKAQDSVEKGRILFEAAGCRRNEFVEATHRRLSSISLDYVEAKYADASMIMNYSYLIERTKEDCFDETMAELGRCNPSYLRFNYIGPFPPYSFVPLEFRCGNFETIDQARKTLALSESVRFSDIKAAYRHLSLQYHPDRNPHDVSTAVRFQQIVRAYEILKTYCLSCDPQLDDDTEYSFAQNVVNNVFMMTEIGRVF